MRRNETQFLALFADGSKVWKRYSPDISTTAAFAAYCSARPELRILLVPTAKEATALYSRIKKLSIPSLSSFDPCGTAPFVPDRPTVEPGVTAYVDLRWWADDGHNWYFALPLPDVDTRPYVVPVTYLNWSPGSKQRYISVRCDLFDEVFEWNTY